MKTNGEANSMSEMKKILFCGIDNAGKTSILHVLKKNYSFLNKLKPTKGIERSKSKILELEFVLWDLGGQKQYLSQYFDRKEFIFSDLSLLYFIIDIQDEMRFDSVLEYLENIITVFRETNQNPSIIVFFHKIDPDIKHTTNVKLFTKDLHKKVTKIAPDFNIAFFNTSIFERWSIIAAFSSGIRALSDKNVQRIIEYLEEWAEHYGANSVLLMNEDDIVIGEFSKDDISAKIMNQYLDELRNLFAVSQKPVILHMNGDLLTFNPVKVGSQSLFLIKYTNDPKITEGHFTESAQVKNEKEFEKLLVNFFQKV